MTLTLTLTSSKIYKLTWFWAFSSSLFYLVFGGLPGSPRSEFYRLFTGYILQDIPLLTSAYLCFYTFNRYGAIHWLLIGIALASYLLGNIFFTSWDIVWHLEPSGCLGDPFYIAFYVLLFSAILIVLLESKIRLNIFQIISVSFVGFYAITISRMISTPLHSDTASLPLNPDHSLINPQIITGIDKILKPYGDLFNNFYVASDIILLLMSLILFLGTWNSMKINWRLMVQAVICFYIADVWFTYASNIITGYQNGFVLEVFWIFGALQFGVAAVDTWKDKTRYDFQ